MLDEFPCNTQLHTADINGDGKTDLVVPLIVKLGNSDNTPKATYTAISRRNDGSYEALDIKLKIQQRGGRTLFADVNHDGLPDAIQSGFSDHVLRASINNGSTFSEPVDAFAWDGVGEQDKFFHLAVQLDSNGDGLRDLLMPLDGGVAPNVESSAPRWFVLEATGAPNGPPFKAAPASIPFEPRLEEAITLADPRGARLGDVNGDGALDVMLVVEGVFNIFQNLAADQDVLVGIADGMNDHDPEDPEFVPTVSISYAHLTDDWITNGSDPADPARESYSYLSHSNSANDCDFPRHCAVGPRRVVSGYSLNDGEGGQRRFGVRYRDGRYHKLGFGDLGFEERIITDLDTGADTGDFFDNRTFIESGDVRAFPYARQVMKQWRWYPPLPGQPNPGPIELFFTDATPSFIATNDESTYFTVPVKRRVRHVQGTFPSPQDPSKSLETYAVEVEAKGGAPVLRDTTLTISDVDDFGNVLSADVSTIGLDLTLHIERTIKNDTARWVLGQLQTQKECSSASMQTQCRSLTRTTTEYGEIATERIDGDNKSDDVALSYVYVRDDFGNVIDVLAEDAYGHHRAAHVAYDPQGMFPVSHTNAAGHVTVLDFDHRFGVLQTHTDPNQLVTTMAYDSLGRIEHVERPDGSTTTITRTRTKSGGPSKTAWRVTEETATSGGEDEIVELDSLSRPIRVLSHGADTIEQPDAPPRVMQIIGYDRLSGNVARRSVPISEGTPMGQVPYDVFDFDALGREVRHVTPWNATTTTVYKGLTEFITDPLLFVTTVDKDALGRPVTITDAMKGATKYTYGPFETLYTVTDPGGAVTRTTRDALGRVWKFEDPDRGTTLQVHDGFGDLLSSVDALGRQVSFEVDALGRTKSRTDKKGAETLITTWTWDTAPHGIGKLHTLSSPDALKTYSYNARAA